MPQLDVLILDSQLMLFTVFFFGYLLTLKYLLPFLSFRLKLRNKLILSNLKWFDKNAHLMVFSSRSFLVNGVKICSLFFLLNKLERDRFTFFNLTPIDFYYIREKQLDKSKK